MSNENKKLDELSVGELMDLHLTKDLEIIQDLNDGAPGYQGIEGHIRYLQARLLLTASILQALGRKVAAFESASKEPKV